jgi:hypothetical protein
VRAGNAQLIKKTVKAPEKPKIFKLSKVRSRQPHTSFWLLSRRISRLRVQSVAVREEPDEEFPSFFVEKGWTQGIGLRRFRASRQSAPYGSVLKGRPN